MGTGFGATGTAATDGTLPLPMALLLLAVVGTVVVVVPPNRADRFGIGALPPVALMVGLVEAAAAALLWIADIGPFVADDGFDPASFRWLGVAGAWLLTGTVGTMMHNSRVVTDPIPQKHSKGNRNGRAYGI